MLALEEELLELEELELDCELELELLLETELALDCDEALELEEDALDVDLELAAELELELELVTAAAEGSFAVSDLLVQAVKPNAVATVHAANIDLELKRQNMIPLHRLMPASTRCMEHSSFANGRDQHGRR